MSDSAHIKDWFIRLGESLNVGVLVISRDFNIIYYNHKAPELLDIVDIEGAFGLSFKHLLDFMSGRGDFGKKQRHQAIDPIVDLIRTKSSNSNADKPVVKITPPNGRSLGIDIQNLESGEIIIVIKEITESVTQYAGYKITSMLGKSGFWHYDFAKNKFTMNSPYFYSILTPEERQRLDQESIFSLIHPDDLLIAQTEWKKAATDISTLNFVIRIKTQKRGSLWFRSHGKPLLSTNKKLIGFICCFADVSEEFQMQEELRAARDEAQSSLNAQTNFLARLAHEIRTPMNAVVGITDALLYRNKDPVLHSKLELIQTSADNMMVIFEDMLNHIKLNTDELTLNPEPGNPAETIISVCQLWEAQALKNNTKLSWHIDPNVPKQIVFDRHKYEQCINNLLSNAIKFTPNGNVDVVLTTHSDPPNQSLILAVRDTGIGMSPEQQSRIFEAYVQADTNISSQFGGTGLGMNITRRIIEKMGGKINVQSNLGVGSVFALTLPLKQASDTPQTSENNIPQTETQESDAPLSPQLTNETTRNGEETAYAHLKILVVDDNVHNHFVVKSLLDGIVAEIHTALNGREAIELIKQMPIDIVLMDIHMPEMDGIEATFAIRNSNKPWSDIKIIALTADPQYQQLRLCRNIGMDSTIGKPVKLSNLFDAFEDVLQEDRETPQPDDATRLTGT